MNHIATSRRRAAAETGTGAGSPQTGPTQNGIAQGQCAFDVAKGIAGALVDHAGTIAGVTAGLALGGGTPAGMLGGTVSTSVSAAQAAMDAFNASQACQDLDNATLANELGLGAIQAP